MRIGVDMLALQSPHSRGRGIGRYATSLLSTMIEAAPDTEFLLYAHRDFPTERFPKSAKALFVPMPASTSPEAAVDELARTNPDDLDHLLILSPFEVGLNYAPPAKPLNGLTMSAVVYDLLPFLFQERHLTDPASAAQFYRNFERLRRYDRLLAISEATRVDLLRLLGIAPDRTINIQGASDPTFFFASNEDGSDTDLTAISKLGINRDFVFCVASADPRKNLWGLIDAFRLLRPELRENHQLVVTCFLSTEDALRVKAYAETRGVAGSLVLTGEVSDETLRLLYRRCKIFAFPSLYEGLGLPLLEAMHCGAAVIAGNNSSQLEFVGDAGLLVNAHDPGDIAAKLAQVLTDPALLKDLQAQAQSQANKFDWRITASRALDAIRASTKPTTKHHRVHSAHQSKQRIALFSPFPPKASGIADYSARLALELRHTYAVDLYHDAGYVPNLGPHSHEFAMYDHRLFERNSRLLAYHATLYQTGNSLYHRYIYEALTRHPGLVTLHDYGLAGFHHGYSHQDGVPVDHFEIELRHSHPERSDHVLANMDSWVWNEGTVQDAFSARDLPMNRRVIECATNVLVHSPSLADRARMQFPEFRDKISVVPMGSQIRLLDPDEKLRIRRRFGLGADRLLFASFGILHSSKMNEETIAAFAKIAKEVPNAMLLFVGSDLSNGEARALAEVRNLQDRVRFLGRQSASDFKDLTAAIDVGICLRRPPTNGETSAALLDLLRHGIPTIVTETGTFRDYLADVVRHVPWEAEGVEGISRAMIDLARSREELGKNAAMFVAHHHSWKHCAAKYVDAIESRNVRREAALPNQLKMRHRERSK